MAGAEEERRREERRGGGTRQNLTTPAQRVRKKVVPKHSISISIVYVRTYVRTYVLTYVRILMAAARLRPSEIRQENVPEHNEGHVLT